MSSEFNLFSYVFCLLISGVRYETYDSEPYDNTYACDRIFDMMCHSGNYEHVMDTMLSKVRHYWRNEFPGVDDIGLLRSMVKHYIHTLKRVDNLVENRDEFRYTTRPIERARRQWQITIMEHELKVYEGWELFTVKQLAKSQVDVDLKRLTIPYKFDMLKFRAFFRSIEDDATLSLSNKRNIVQSMEGGLIISASKKDILLTKTFLRSWPTRKQLVKAGFLSNKDYEPVHMFHVIRRCTTRELFAYMAPKIQAFMHDMRGSKCMFDIDYDALANHIRRVPILPQRR